MKIYETQCLLIHLSVTVALESLVLSRPIINLQGCKDQDFFDKKIITTIAKCLNIDPEKRPTAEDLERYLHKI